MSENENSDNGASTTENANDIEQPEGMVVFDGEFLEDLDDTDFEAIAEFLWTLNVNGFFSAEQVAELHAQEKYGWDMTDFTEA